MQACRPVSTSAMATPTLVGGPPSGPVIDIRPPMACTTKSYPGRSAPAPVPNPEIEQ